MFIKPPSPDAATHIIRHRNLHPHCRFASDGSFAFGLLWRFHQVAVSVLIS